jgi:hypothetical protein
MQGREEGGEGRRGERKEREEKSKNFNADITLLLANFSHSPNKG